MAQARRLLDNATFDPALLKIVRQAFDEAWEAIAGNYGTASGIDAARTRLATVILRTAAEGVHDLAQIKDAALQAMRDSEQPLQFPQAHRN